MNARELKVLSNFPDKLDEIINERYPKAEAKSHFSLGEMSMVTTFKGKGAVRKEINAFVTGFIAGNQELVERLHALGK